MGTRLVDEREHRRGLILGLTLAEVLLLLLFLIMLALSIPLKEFYDATHVAQDEISALRKENERLENLLALRPDNNVSRISERLQKVEKFFSGLKDSQLDEFLHLLKPLLADTERLKALEQFLQLAIRIDPDDPPASIRRATAAISVIGKDIKPEQLSALKPMVKNEASLQQFAGLYKEAAKINPDDPPAALRPLDEATKMNLPLASALAQIGGLPSDPNEAQKKVKEGLDALSRGHNWPPIIVLGDDHYRFKTLSAELTGNFEANLKKLVVPLLVQYAKEYRVDTIEVIGHTDEQAITQPRNSNLDASLLSFLRRGGSASVLSPADNAGLGMARAVAVARLLMNDPNLAAYREKILPLSGAQLISTDDRITKGVHGDIRERRRIEIRLRRSQSSVVSMAH
jgi:outer membrane protein OmpA-like peptidoglycan-associated protein